MATWNNGSLRAGQKIRNSQGGDSALSKLVELNGNYRMFFKTFIDEYDVYDEDGVTVLQHNSEGNIRAAVVPGRTGDYDIIGTGFIPYTEDMYIVDPITEKFIDTTPLDDWARIARVLFEAQCASEKKSAEAEAQRSAQEMGRAIDQVSLQRKLEGIELKYHGGKAADGTNVMPSVNPALSSNIVFKVSTRVLLVRMSADEVPDWKNAKYAVFEASKARTDELINLLNTKKYFGGEYLEVGYNYTGADKKEAGKNAKLQGIVKSDSLEELFPNEWKSVGKKMVENIATGTPEEQVSFIRSRNRSFRGGHTPADIISAYKKWCSTNQAVFGSIDFSDGFVAGAAKLFLENHLVDSMPYQLEEFKKLASKSKSDDSNDSEGDSVSVEQSAGTVTSTVSQSTMTVSEEPVKEVDPAAAAAAMNMFASGEAQTQTLRELAKQAPNIDISGGDDLGDL